MANRMDHSVSRESLLGTYLRKRRAKLDPAALGFPPGRRRPPGLRREEVAQRANISPTWYTWLEQGRGGAPSAEVLDRIAGALALSDVEREHLHPLAVGPPPQGRPAAEGPHRTAGARALAEVEREHLPLLASGPPPEGRRGGAGPGGVTPQ